MGQNAPHGGRSRRDAYGRRASAALLAAVCAAGCLVVGSAADAAGAVAPEPVGRSPSAVAVGSVPAPVAAAPSASLAPTGPWRWPLDPRPAVVRGFDPPEVVWGAGHRGVDLAAEVAQPVLAPTAGVVTFSGVVVDRGVVVLATPTGLRVTFEPVDDALPEGTTVSGGDPVGRVAAMGGHCAPATCLHWGVRRGDTYLDPVAFVGGRRVVLLPLRPG